jgi:hypothetical protein
MGNNLACSTHCNHRIAATLYIYIRAHTHTLDIVQLRYKIVNTLIKVIIIIIIFTIIIIINTLVFEDTNAVKNEDKKILKYKELTI